MRGKTVNSDVKGLMFEFEHLFLEGNSAGGGKAAHFTVGADDAATRDNQRRGLSRQHATNGSTGLGIRTM
jgi:hypothetical protein